MPPHANTWCREGCSVPSRKEGIRTQYFKIECQLHPNLASGGEGDTFFTFISCFEENVLVRKEILTTVTFM